MCTLWDTRLKLSTTVLEHEYSIIVWVHALNLNGKDIQANYYLYSFQKMRGSVPEESPSLISPSHQAT